MSLFSRQRKLEQDCDLIVQLKCDIIIKTKQINHLFFGFIKQYFCPPIHIIFYEAIRSFIKR